MSTLILLFRVAMYFSFYVERKVPKERHLRETPTVSPLRIPLPTVRDILHPQNV